MCIKRKKCEETQSFFFYVGGMSKSWLIDKWKQEIREVEYELRMKYDI